MNRSPGKLWGLRRLADEHGLFKMVAIDQRPPIMNPIQAKLQVARAPDQDVAQVKRLLAGELAAQASAMLIDPIWAYAGCIDLLRADRGLVLTLEDHRFEDRPDGRLSRLIPDWSVEKIKRIGGDAVKLLVWYRPDASAEVCDHQASIIAEIGAECRRLDIAFVLELLVYPFAQASNDYQEDPDKRPELVIESVRKFAHEDYGVDLLKLESPLPIKAAISGDDHHVQAIFDALGEACSCPWVMLSAGSDKPAFEQILKHAFKAGASGFLAGRTIWAESFAKWPDMNAMAGHLREHGIPYLQRINLLADAHARSLHPWLAAQSMAKDGFSFDLPSRYPK